MRLDINYKKNKCKKHKHVEVKNTFLNNQCVTVEIKRDIKKNSTNKWQWKYGYSKPMNVAKPILRGKFITVKSYPKKQEKH